MITDAIRSTVEYKRILDAMQGKAGVTALFGLPPVARTQVIATLSEETGRSVLVVTPTEAEATRIAEDANILGIAAAVYPARDFVMRNIEGQSREYEYRRLEVLGGLVGGRIQLVAAPIEAVLQYTLPKEEFMTGTLTIKAGQTLRQEDLLGMLFAAGYHRRSQVDGPGQFSARGDIIDLYAPDMESPSRIEYWGDEIESIHAFDLLTQRRERKVSKIYLSPAREVLFGNPADTAAFLRGSIANKKTHQKGNFTSILEHDITLLEAGVVPEGMDKYLSLRYPKPACILDYFENPLVLFDEPSAIREEEKSIEFRSGEEYKTLLEEGVLAPGLDKFYQKFAELLSAVEKENTIFAENFARSLPDVRLLDNISFSAHGMPPLMGDVASLMDELRPMIHEKYFCVVMAGTTRAATALTRDLDAAGFAVGQAKQGDVIEPKAGNTVVISGRLSAGVVYPGAKLAIFTGRKTIEAKKKKAKAKNKGLSSLSDITAGDYVVHQNHGIGVYVGIQRLDLHGVVKDYLKISYDKADTLYVPVTQLDLLSRYTAPGDGDRVKLAKLGGGEWTKTKNRVRHATEEMAKELIELYAKRQHSQGFPFPEDGEWQRDFETRFEYEETQDQLLSALEIKKDMEKTTPMDRLLCGDVGVGKTEVALRAAFKCVMGGKQCAILVPTTILAWQHYNTMLTRMEAFPVNIQMLSRFSTPKQQKDTKKGLADGTVDLVVGTHSLLQSSVKFKNLGLVIIDEEQRFGVKHKERLKENFIGVDMLTLSATPIPRTLNMALSGIRDMSTIEEPPIERQPIETYVMEYEEETIVSAIRKEIGRGGQVYYLHNRVDTIDATVQKLQNLLPDARIGVAHGRMDEESLSRVWQHLLDAEIDILVCTTIIETGIDVRNCNTLIIENADRMGLAQLYQIRGRVGRSGRKAYAYFTFQRGKVLTDVAAKRLSAIREFTAFGSGFRIAMRDLQIRGAGNLLGQSQSGHMEAVGYDLYVKMLNQAIAMEKGEVLQADKSECLIDITVDAFIPEKYISDAAGRIEAYKKIAAIESPEGASDVMEELADRYGAVIPSVKGLIDISLLRVIAAQLGVYEILQKNDNLLIYSDKINFPAAKIVLRPMGVPVLVNASTKPYLSVRVPANEKPIEVLNHTVRMLQENVDKIALQ